MRNQKFEIPFIAFYRKEHIDPELTIRDLWTVYRYDEKVNSNDGDDVTISSASLLSFVSGQPLGYTRTVKSRKEIFGRLVIFVKRSAAKLNQNQSTLSHVILALLYRFL